MKQEVEIEFKNLLTKQEFNKLTEFFSIKKSDFKEQENFYFDTPSFDLKKKSTALRIRRKSDKYTLTLKQPHENGLLETHQSISKKEASEMIDGKRIVSGDVANIISNNNINPDHLIFLGSLTTSRAEVSYDIGTIVLDHSKYLNMEDYELEFEVSNYNTGKVSFEKLLDLMIIPKRSTSNKIQRFFSRKKELSENSK